MSDAISKETANAFIKSGDLGKILIFVLVIFLMVLGSVMWILQSNNIQQLDEFKTQGKSLKTLSDGLSKMLTNQANVNELRRDIYIAYTMADKEFDDAIKILGTVLQGYKIPFPQDLNMALKDFRAAFKVINSKLIMLDSK